MGSLCAQYLKRFFLAGLALVGSGLGNVYAETVGNDSVYEHEKRGNRIYEYSLMDPWVAWRRMNGWENPITGQRFALPSKYRLSTVRSGLHWKVHFSVRNDRKGFNEENATEFEFFIIRFPEEKNSQAKILEEYELKPEDNRKHICGQKILQGRAFNKQGGLYAFSQLEAVFGEDKKKYNVLFIHHLVERPTFIDDYIFCPIVQSFYSKEKIPNKHLKSNYEFLWYDDDNPSMIDSEYLWYNPVSDKFLAQLGSGVKIQAEDIVAHRFGTYQAYKVTKDKLHSGLIKITGDPYFVDTYKPIDIEDLHLRDGTVIHWEKRSGKINSYQKYEGSFIQTAGKNEKQSGFVYGTITQDGVVLIKTWRDDGRPLAEDDHAFVQKLFENSVPN